MATTIGKRTGKAGARRKQSEQAKKLRSDIITRFLLDAKNSFNPGVVCVPPLPPIGLRSCDHYGQIRSQPGISRSHRNTFRI